MLKCIVISSYIKKPVHDYWLVKILIVFNWRQHASRRDASPGSKAILYNIFLVGRLEDSKYQQTANTDNFVIYTLFPMLLVWLMFCVRCLVYLFPLRGDLYNILWMFVWLPGVASLAGCVLSPINNC